MGRANHPHDGLAIPGNRDPVTAHAAGYYQALGERGIVTVRSAAVKRRFRCIKGHVFVNGYPLVGHQ
jgi:hypothetical protein